jgi:hypothetical protein
MVVLVSAGIDNRHDVARRKQLTGPDVRCSRCRIGFRCHWLKIGVRGMDRVCPGIAIFVHRGVVSAAGLSEMPDIVAYTVLPIVPRRIGESLFDIDHFGTVEGHLSDVAVNSLLFAGSR